MPNNLKQMEQIITQLVANFDFAYMLVINIMTYLIIYNIEAYHNISVTKQGKRLVLIISITIVTIIYCIIGYNNKIILVNSAIASPIAWTWVIKPIFNRIGLGYKRNNKLN